MSQLMLVLLTKNRFSATDFQGMELSFARRRWRGVVAAVADPAHRPTVVANWDRVTGGDTLAIFFQFFVKNRGFKSLISQ